ncbi:MAG: hypothetical protein HPY76_05430 [Anaerolineae bacterium]|nr:hypothetical protein [Anaerolineae bacterium]
MKPTLMRTLCTLALAAAILLPALPAAAAPRMLDDLEVTADAKSRSDSPGSLVTYILTVKNNTGASDTYNITFASDWAVTTNPSTAITVEGGSEKLVYVYVTIPDNAGTGDSNQTTVTIASGAAFATIELITKAKGPTQNRPIITIQSYAANVGTVQANQEFDLQVTLRNEGSEHASNLLVSFQSSDFYMLDTGGVVAMSSLVAHNSSDVEQPMKAVSDLADKEAAAVTVSISYTGPDGAAYSESFSLSVPLKPTVYATVKPTVTGTPVPRPQVVVRAYRASIEPLQPGTIFDLELEIENLGNAEAQGVTLVVGGSINTGGGSETPVVGGIGGGSGDLTNFAPVGTSNLFYVGDIAAGQQIRGTQQLIVNVNTQPGAYPLKLSFIYTDSRGNRLQDDQAITLMVYSLPQIEISFYRDPGMLLPGQPNILPLQVTNLGRKTTVLGNMKVTADAAMVNNGVTLVGALDAGGYYTLDAEVIPDQAGPLDLTVAIGYTDDFNNPRTIEQVLTLDVMDVPTPELFPGEQDGEFTNLPPQETFWDKVARFLKGLIGLDSGIQQPQPEVPFEGGDGGGGGGGGEVQVIPAG